MDELDRPSGHIGQLAGQRWASGVVEDWPDDPRAAEPDREAWREIGRRGLAP